MKSSDLEKEKKNLYSVSIKGLILEHILMFNDSKNNEVINKPMAFMHRVKHIFSFIV